MTSPGRGAATTARYLPAQVRPWTPSWLVALLASERQGSGGVAARPKDVFDLATAAARVLREVAEVRGVPLDRGDLHGEDHAPALYRGQVDYAEVRVALLERSVTSDE